MTGWKIGWRSGVAAGKCFRAKWCGNNSRHSELSEKWTLLFVSILDQFVTIDDEYQAYVSYVSMKNDNVKSSDNIEEERN